MFENDFMWFITILCEYEFPCYSTFTSFERLSDSVIRFMRFDELEWQKKKIENTYDLQSHMTA